MIALILEVIQLNWLEDANQIVQMSLKTFSHLFLKNQCIEFSAIVEHMQCYVLEFYLKYSEEHNEENAAFLSEQNSL